VLASLLPYVLVYKYLGIFVITFLGAIALPLPSGSVLMAASAFAVQGYMNFPLVLLTGIVGNVAGDNAGYWLVRIFGMSAVKKAGFGRFFKEDKLDGAREQIENHRFLTIYISRFMTAIAPAVNVVCGFTRLPYKEYLLFEALGEISECALFCAIGYIFGSNWEYINQLSGKLWIIVLAGALTSYMVGRVIFKKR
jgi:membrane-associated protein